MANAPLILTRAEFRGWFENFNAFVYDEAYTKLEYDKWNTLNIWSRKDSDWKEIAIDWAADGEVIWIYSRDEIRLSPNSVIVGRNDLSFGRFLWDMIMDYYDNLEIKMKAVGDSAKAAAETISKATMDWDKFSPFISIADTAYGNIDITSNEFYVNGIRLSDYVKNIVEEVNNNDKKENKEMKFGNFDFGPVDSSVRMSMYGMAIKNASGTYVAYDKASDSVIDVDILNFEGANKFIYKMPAAIKDVAVGDVVIHARKPMFVQEILENNRLVALDIFDGEEKTIVLTKSMFGFEFITKVVSLVDFAAGADASNPFGNMLPLLLMNDGKADNMLPLLMMSQGTDLTANPMLMYALMSDSRGSNDNLLPLMLMINHQSCGKDCKCKK